MSLLLDHVQFLRTWAKAIVAISLGIFSFTVSKVLHNEYPSTRKYVNANTNKQKIINQNVIFKRLGLIMLFHLFFNSRELDTTLTNDPYRISLH